MVSAIILNYLNSALTAKSVDYLLEAASKSSIAVEVIVVDNSAPKTAEELRKLLPEGVKIIENKENRGFAAANNQGIKQANGDVILIMNNDLFMNEQVLKNGIEYITSNKKAGIWSPKLVSQSGEAQRSCAYFPTLRGVVSEYLFKYQLENRLSITANKANHPVEVDSVMGACMFIQKEVLQKAGLFDEEYFFTKEDVDLCKKIKALNYKVVFDPRYEAIHIYHASQDYNWYKDPYLHKARKLYFKKHFNPLKALAARITVDAGIKVRKLKHRLFER